MSGDPSRRPSNERIRIATDVNAVVWIECGNCLGDGWHYPMGWAADSARKSRKVTCTSCEGLGRRQVPRLQCGPSVKIVGPPAGWVAR